MKRELYKAVKKNKYADKKKDFFVVVVLTVSEYGRGSYKKHELYSCVLRLKMLDPTHLLAFLFCICLIVTSCMECSRVLVLWSSQTYCAACGFV